MRLSVRILLPLLLATFVGQAARAQGSCGFFDPKVTFADGSQACLTDYPLMSRPGILSSTAFKDPLAAAKANPRNFAFATPAEAQRCPFVAGTAWGLGSLNAKESLDVCTAKLKELAKNSTDVANCACEVLIQDGRSRLSRAEFSNRFAAYERFLATGRVAPANASTSPAPVTSDAGRVEEERQRRGRQELALAEQQKIQSELADRERLVVEARRIQAQMEARLKAEEEARRKEQAERERVQLELQALKTELERSRQTATVNFAHRKALVIGIDSYQHISRLNRAREDAAAIAEALRAAGFAVTLHLDLGEKAMRAALRKFSGDVQGGDEVAFFFAGHGVQLGGINYLVPMDITGESEGQLREDAISLQRILDDMTERRAKVTLAVIDACRDNPFKVAGRNIGGGTRGLAPTTPASGQMVIFSAGNGQRALDSLGPTDTSRNGVFVRVFLREIQQRGVPIDRAVRNARTEVVRLARTIDHDQVPAIYDQLLGEFYFYK